MIPGKMVLQGIGGAMDQVSVAKRVSSPRESVSDWIEVTQRRINKFA